MLAKTENDDLRKSEETKGFISTEEEVPECQEPDVSSPSFNWTPLDITVVDLLKKLKKRTDAIHKVNVTKARAKRTFVSGLHESFKHLMADNVKCIIMARNIEVELFEGFSLYHRLRVECIKRNIPIVHASSKRCLSRALKRFPYTNVVALFGFQAYEEIYRDIIRMWKESDSHIQYHLDQLSLFA